MKKGRRAMSLLAALSILFMVACGAEQTESDPAPTGTKPADAIQHNASHESSEADQAGGDMTLIFRDGRANVRVQSVWEGDPFANEEGKANL